MFTDDVRLPGMLHVAYVRSAAARGRIVSIGMEAAREMPGVHAIYTQADLSALPVNMITFRSEEHTSELQSLMRNSYAVFCLQKKHTQTSLHYQLPLSAHL